jgi:hypothetical protein
MMAAAPVMVGFAAVCATGSQAGRSAWVTYGLSGLVLAAVMAAWLWAGLGVELAGLAGAYGLVGLVAYLVNGKQTRGSA